MPKARMDELSIKVAAHAHDAWVKKAVWTCMLGLILFDDVEVDVSKTVFANCFDDKSVATRVEEGTR